MPAMVLETVVADYYGYLDSMGYAEATKSSSRTILTRLMDHYGARRPFNRLTSTHIDAFMTEEAKRRTGAGLTNSHSRLSAFFSWAEGTGRVKHSANPMNMRRAPKYTKREQSRVHVSKFPLILDMAGEVSPHLRAEMAIAMYSLLRIGEVKLLRVRDLDLQAGELLADIPKTHDTDRVPVSGELDAELRAWLRTYQELCGPLQPDWYLIPRVDREPKRGENGQYLPEVDRRVDPTRPLVTLSKYYRTILREAGAPSQHDDGTLVRVGPHTLRRSGARAMYDRLVADGRADALRIVQTMLHHANMEMTQHYIGVRADRETRDLLIKGVHLFGFNETPRLGVDHGYRDAARHVV